MTEVPLVVGAESSPKGSDQPWGNERAERLVGCEHREPACRVCPEVHHRVCFHGWKKPEERFELGIGVTRLGLNYAAKDLLNLVGREFARKAQDQETRTELLRGLARLVLGKLADSDCG